jgi:hypothetical protein
MVAVSLGKWERRLPYCLGRRRLFELNILRGIEERVKEPWEHDGADGLSLMQVLYD